MTQLPRIAPEILCEVFIHCVPLLYEELDSDLSWINVTYVNHYWREVALGCPELWTNIIFSRPMWTPVMLSRAKMAPLVIRADLNRNCVDLVQAVLETHISRIRELDIRAPHHILENTFYHWQLIAKAAQLEFLFVSNIDHGNTDPVVWWVPEDILNDHTIQHPVLGNLRHLELRACAFAWDSPQYTLLTDLKLFYIHPAQRPKMPMFLSLLESMHGLRDLTIVHATPPADEDFFMVFPKVTVELPRLVSLILTDPAIDCTNLLERLSLPSTATMKLSCFVSDPAEWTFNCEICRRLIPVVAAHWAGNPIYTSAQIHILHGIKFILSDLRGHECLNLHLRCYMWTQSQSVAATSAMITSFPVAHIVSLELGGINSNPGTESNKTWEWRGLWKELIRFEQLRVLHLNRTVPSMLLELLLQRAMHCIGIGIGACVQGIGPDGIRRQLLPMLERVVLHGVDCSDVGGGTRPPVMDILLSLLWVRYQGRCSITKLEFLGCKYVFTQTLTQLRFLAEVAWDGEGRDISEREDFWMDPMSFSIRVSLGFMGLTWPWRDH